MSTSSFKIHYSSTSLFLLSFSHSLFSLYVTVQFNFSYCVCPENIRVLRHQHLFSSFVNITIIPSVPGEYLIIAKAIIILV